MTWKIAGAVLLVAALVLCFVDKPVHLDDPNFLRLAEGVAQDPWRPHDISINWLGTTERAFDVLSNPPGIAYWLAPVRRAPEWVLHLWMLPWLALALYGIARLARAFEVPAHRAILVLGTSPVFVLAAQSLMPDLPLLACATAGIGGFAAGGRRAWAWALLAGCATLFRYSGLCVIPLVLWLGVERGRLRAALLVLVPAALLVMHDLAAYGQIHALASAGFQGRSFAAKLVFRKLVAALAMLGGACLLPVLPWRRGALPFAAAGALLGLAAGWRFEEDAAQLAATALSTAAGGLALGALAVRTREDRFLALWFLGGCAFLLTLLFVATRYWLPFVPALALAALRRPPSRARVTAAVAVSAVLAFALARDDDRFARAYRDAAREITSSGPPGLVSGHWGWQYYMEQGGWRPTERGEAVTDRAAFAFAPWPQAIDTTECLRVETKLTLEAGWPIRVLSREGAANFHIFELAGPPSRPSFAPWTLATDPYDRVFVLKRCENGPS